MSCFWSSWESACSVAGLSREQSTLQDPDASHEGSEIGKSGAGSDTRIHQTIQQVKAQVAKRLGGGGGSDGLRSAIAHEVTHPVIYGILETSGERFTETTKAQRCCLKQELAVHRGGKRWGK